jgi:enterochelin esterase-like enzyme
MIEWITVKSKALEGFPVEDNSSRDLPVYVPPSYNPKRKTPYPVALILAGWGSKGSSLIADDSAFGLSLPKRLDQAIAEKRLPECIVAFPDGSTRYGGSQYINSPSFGYYSDYICDEISHSIDTQFHTYGDAHYRAILGHSSGGFGALINAVLRPDRFLFVGSSAGDTFFEMSLLPVVKHAVDEIEKSGSLEKFIEDFLSHPNPKSLPRSKGETMMLLSLAGCYAPGPVAPLYGDLFFDLKTGKIDHEIWERYLSWDPLHFFPRHSESASKIRYIYLDAGKQDEYGLQLGHRQLASTLTQLQIPHRLDEFHGGHSGQTWRYETRLKNILDQMLSLE